MVRIPPLISAENFPNIKMGEIDEKEGGREERDSLSLLLRDLTGPVGGSETRKKLRGVSEEEGTNGGRGRLIKLNRGGRQTETW